MSKVRKRYNNKNPIRKSTSLKYALKKNSLQKKENQTWREEHERYTRK